MASPAKWASVGSDDAAAWGEAIGSGSSPYQTAVDLKDLAYKCSCPSRKLPCKHALGLLFRYAKGELEGIARPPWVAEWLEQRAARATKQSEKATAGPPDIEAAQKRVEKRWSNILAGLDQCESFLVDAASQGLLAVQSTRSWDQMAARMVDAQAPGVATLLRRVGARIGVGEGWATTVSGQIGSLALLNEAARRVDELDEGLRSDVATALGIPTRKEDVSGEAVSDTWDVIGQIVQVEDRLSTCRTWLKGRSTGRWGMHLTFSVAGQPFDSRPIAGSALECDARYAPSSWPLRVYLEPGEMVPFRPNAGRRFSSCLDSAADAWAHNPWLEQVPVHISKAVLGRDEKSWYAIDEGGEALPLGGREPWGLLSMTGNVPCEMFGEWNGRDMRLLAAWGNWGYFGL